VTLFPLVFPIQTYALVFGGFAFTAACASQKFKFSNWQTRMIMRIFLWIIAYFLGLAWSLFDCIRQSGLRAGGIRDTRNVSTTHMHKYFCVYSLRDPRIEGWVGMV